MLLWFKASSTSLNEYQTFTNFNLLSCLSIENAISDDPQTAKGRRTCKFTQKTLPDFTTSTIFTASTSPCFYQNQINLMSHITRLSALA